jgi:hypothetical protein
MESSMAWNGSVSSAALLLAHPKLIGRNGRIKGAVRQHQGPHPLGGRIIEFIIDTVTLLPGDVIAIGTPGGVGVGRDPKVFLHPGDVVEVEVEVEPIGVVRNPTVDRKDLA